MGVGQGIFGPTYMGLIAQYHDSTTRGRAMSFHQTSSYIGVVVCSVLAGYIADHLGWQYACYIFGGLGVLFTGWMAIRLKDKKAAAPVQKIDQPSFKEGLSAFFRVPTAICMLIAYTCVIFTITGYLTWMPKYIKETFDLSTASAGFHSMFWTNITAFAGVMIGGTIADRIVIKRKSGANRLWLQVTGILLAAPCVALMGISQNMIIVCIALAGFGLFRGLFECATYPVLYDVISSKYYSLSSAIMILFGFSIGALAPWILGIIGDTMGLSKGFIILAAVWSFASVALILARLKFYNKDSILVKE
jgi:predicted MFS family arabinose efflux permease